MQYIAKVFANGRSQAVRLPVEFRFDCPEVFVRRDPISGDVILSQKPDTWSDVFAYLDTLDIPEDFLIDRSQPIAQIREEL